MNIETIFRKIKGKYIFTAVMGVLTMLVSAFFVFCFALEGDVNIGLYIAVLALAGLEIFMVVQGVRCAADPMKAPQLKDNPRLPEMAEELFSNVKFEDKIIVMSDRIIASKRDLTQMAYFSEVIMVYEYTHSTNFITDNHKIKLETPDYTALIDVYAYSEDKINGLIDMLFRFCPNAVPCGSQQELHSRIRMIEQDRKARKKRG